MEGAWEAADELTRNVLENWDTNQIHDAGYREELKRQLDFAYPFAEEQRFQMKFTVSELKKRAYMEEEAGEVLYQEPEAVPLVPRFLGAEEAASGAVRGTAYHKFLELLDFEKRIYQRKSGGTFETSSDRRKDQSGDRRGCKNGRFPEVSAM